MLLTMTRSGGSGPWQVQNSALSVVFKGVRVLRIARILKASLSSWQCSKRGSRGKSERGRERKKEAHRKNLLENGLSRPYRGTLRDYPRYLYFLPRRHSIVDQVVTFCFFGEGREIIFGNYH